MMENLDEVFNSITAQIALLSGISCDIDNK